MGKCRYPLQVETGEGIYEIEAEEDQTLGAVMSRAIPEQRWEETMAHTTSGQAVNLRDRVGDVVRRLGDTRFRVSSKGDLGSKIPSHSSKHESAVKDVIPQKIPLRVRIANEISEFVADGNQSMREIFQCNLPGYKSEIMLIITPSGFVVNPREKLIDIFRKVEDNFFILVEDCTVESTLPTFPPNLRTATRYSPNWQERLRLELWFIRSLNREVATKNKNFCYIKPQFGQFNNRTVTMGYITTCLGKTPFLVILNASYPISYPEVSLYRNNFMEVFEKACSKLKKHTNIIAVTIDGKKIPTICGDGMYLKRWTGRKGVAHYVSDVLFDWLKHAEEVIRRAGL